MSNLLIADAQNVKNAGSAERKSYDVDNKVSGIKRHIAVDTWGFPHAAAVTTADVTDRNGVLEAFDRCLHGGCGIRKILVDDGYTGEPFARAVKEKPGASVEVVKHSERHVSAVLPRRWIVERAFAQAGQVQASLEKLERKLHSSLLFFLFALLALILKKH
jgi:transposase